MSDTFYLIAANSMLILHVMYVLFVVLGLICVLIGGACRWHWVRRPGFRILHFLAIGVVVVQAWLGWQCPLTTWEVSLRMMAGDDGYTGSFIGHWLNRLLYYQAEPWVFTTAYSLFAAIVAASWLWVPPQWRGQKP